jgi:hypothetical protein
VIEVRSAFMLGLVAATTSGCADVEDDGLEDFRHAVVDGDITVHQGTSAAEPDCVLFDILGGDLYAGSASNNRILLTLDGLTMSTDDGVARCVIDTSAPLTRLRVVGDDGPAVYSVWKKWVFEGDFAVPPSGDLPDNVLYTFQTDHIYAGMPMGPNVFATATDNVQFSSAERKLLITAALDGACGGTQ